MLGLIAAGAAVFFGTWLAAAITAAFGFWLPAAILTGVALAAWLAAAAGTLMYIAEAPRRKRTRALLLSGAGVVLALYTLTAWFGALYATIHAYDPTALVSSIPDGFLRPYTIAVDTVIGQGVGLTLPATTAAGAVTMIQELLLSPRLMLAILVAMQFADRPRRDDERRARGDA